MPLLALTKYRGSPLAISIYAKAIAWWEMDDSSSSIVDHVNLHSDSRYNFVWNGGGGISQGNATLRSGGTASMHFPASNGNVLFGGGNYITELVGAIDHSVITWYKPDNVTSTNTRILFDEFNTTNATSAGNRQIAFGLTTAGRPLSIWMFGTHTNETTGSGFLVSAGTIYFLGYSKTVSGKTVDHYSNGALSITRNYVNEPTGGSAQIAALANTYVLIGSAVNGADGYLQGLAVFNGALTAAEHNYLYNGGVGKSWEQIKTEAGH